MQSSDLASSVGHRKDIEAPKKKRTARESEPLLIKQKISYQHISISKYKELVNKIQQSMEEHARLSELQSKKFQLKLDRGDMLARAKSSEEILLKTRLKNTDIANKIEREVEEIVEKIEECRAKLDENKREFSHNQNTEQKRKQSVYIDRLSMKKSFQMQRRSIQVSGLKQKYHQEEEPFIWKTAVCESKPQFKISQKALEVRQLCLSLKKRLIKQTVSTRCELEQELSIQDFKLIKVLGQGKFSRVHLAVHRNTNFIFAIKQISKLTIRKQKCEGQLLRQIKIQSYFNHPNIIRLYSVLSNQTSVYLIMQYCPHGQLYQTFNIRSRFNEQEWIPYMRGICDGLLAIHSEGVFHRDLKPENVMLSYKIAKIGDFGWAIHTKGESRGTFCGTPLYISPEMLVGGSYDAKIDIWALGIMSYEFLTGKIPFKLQKSKSLMETITSEITIPNTLSPSCKQILEQILIHEPQERLGIMDIINHPFLARKTLK